MIRKNKKKIERVNLEQKREIKLNKKLKWK